MDKTEQYIKMSDCPEIQGQWKKEQYGDILACYDKEKIYENGSHYYTLLLAGGPPIRKSKNRIWLPRQDDIQEMMFENLARADAIVHELNKWREGNYDYQLQFITMEQFSLAFYMHEKHSKIWSSEEEKWVKK